MGAHFAVYTVCNIYLKLFDNFKKKFVKLVTSSNDKEMDLELLWSKTVDESILPSSLQYVIGDARNL